ncbi:aldo/keto reductase [Flagellimonas amoyensis]|uniref:aldo/keto reductase n=1 Tax=Flagellimonas amoyensis TaxID=2169401 RepID=UPI000D34E629|nr:aldo/keto reductase [Allomuricauda amoyensis]
MNYRTLGRTNLEISEISLGTWAFGNNVYGGVDEKEAIDTIHTAMDLGINLFDTAPQYGTAQQDGIAEIVLGKGLKGIRDKVCISTKFGRNPCISKGASQFYKSRVVNSVEESLKRLQTDYIDVLFFHSPFFPSEIHDDVWEGIDQVKEQGKVRFVGHSISNFAETKDMALHWALEKKIDVVQVVLSLMNREAEALIQQLQAIGVGVFARECLANGFLSGTIKETTKFAPGSLNSRYSKEELRKRIDQVEAFKFLTRDNKISMPQAALRWTLDQNGVSTVLSGAKNKRELQEAAASSEIEPFDSINLNKAKEVLRENFEAA